MRDRRRPVGRHRSPIRLAKETDQTEAERRELDEEDDA